jgi:hypothetical protein
MFHLNGKCFKQIMNRLEQHSPHNIDNPLIIDHVVSLTNK